MAKKKAKKMTRPPAWIDPDNPPPIGTGYTFRIGNGDIDPRTHTPARCLEIFRLQLVWANLVTITKLVRMRLRIPSGGYPVEGFTITLEHWNTVWAPACSGVHPPEKKAAKK